MQLKELSAVILLVFIFCNLTILCSLQEEEVSWLSLDMHLQIDLGLRADEEERFVEVPSWLNQKIVNNDTRRNTPFCRARRHSPTLETFWLRSFGFQGLRSRMLQESQGFFDPETVSHCLHIDVDAGHSTCLGAQGLG